MYNQNSADENENRAENILEEIMDTIFQNVLKDTDFQIQEAWQTPNKIHKTKQKTSQHFIVKVNNTKDNEKILKAARNKQHIKQKR